MAGGELVGLGLVRRRLLRRAAGVLVLVLDEHRELPVLTWTVTADVLQGHADVCDLDPGRDRRGFNARALALPAGGGGESPAGLEGAGGRRRAPGRPGHGGPGGLAP